MDEREEEEKIEDTSIFSSTLPTFSLNALLKLNKKKKSVNR